MQSPIEQPSWPGRTRQQAAALLEELRALYQALPSCERSAVKAFLFVEAHAQLSKEGKQ